MSEEVIPLSAPDITDAEREAVLAVLQTNRLSIGPHIQGFEAAVAGCAGRKHGIAVNSGTSGLHLCVRALGISEGDEVITTPFSFVATTNCVLFERAKPVFVDVDPETYNLDPKLIEPAITERTKGLLPVEIFGNMAHFAEYERIAKKHGLLMIEDCCEALGGYVDGRPAGGFGDCGVFGFYPNKQITTGEGGVIVTDDDQLAETCRAMRNQGRADNSSCHRILGYNYRMAEMTAALGEVQMSRLDEILEKRRQAAEIYSEALADVEEVLLPKMAQPERAAWFVYVVQLGQDATRQQRQEIIEFMRNRGIGCATYFEPIHLQPYIAELMGTRTGDYPLTERLADRTICLPFFTNLTPEHVSLVKEGLKAAILAVRGSA